MKKISFFTFIFLITLLLPFFSCKEKDTKEFAESSKIIITEYDSLAIHNLSVLCKVWGFLKYYHPAVREGNYNWDFELFRIMPSILDSKSAEERNAALTNWIAGLGEIKEIATDFVDNKNKIKQYPDVSWIENTSALGATSPLLVSIKNIPKSKKSHYVKFRDGVKNPVFQNEEAYQEFPYPDTGYRLLSLFRYWNIIEYYFPYKYLIGENWHEILPEFIPKFIDAGNELEYQLAVLELISRIKDTHAGIVDAEALKKHKGENMAPYEISFIEGKAVVLGFNPDYAITLKKGDILLSIDSVPVDSIVKQQIPYTPASNYPVQLRNIAGNLLRTSKGKLTVEYERDGVTASDIVVCYPMDEIHIPNIYQRDEPLFKLLGNNIGYLYLGSIQGGKVPSNLPTKGLIIDLRCYPDYEKVKGYWTYNALYPDRYPFAKITRGSSRYPGLFTYQYTVEIGKKNKNHYKGKIVLLVNEITQSHAEYVAMRYQAIPNTVVVGSTTSGADGNVSEFTLPGGINTRMTGIGIYYPDGRETQRIGIVPDIEVKPSIKGIREGRDEVLEKAIEIILGDEKND